MVSTACIEENGDPSVTSTADSRPSDDRRDTVRRPHRPRGMRSSHVARCVNLASSRGWNARSRYGSRRWRGAVLRRWHPLRKPPVRPPSSGSGKTGLEPRGGKKSGSSCRRVTSPARSPEFQRVTVQRGLALLGFEVGLLDGICGRRTRAAIRRWQGSSGDPVTGYLDSDGANRLLAAGWRALPRHDRAKRLGTVRYRARIAAAESLDDRRRGTALLAIVLEQAGAGDLRTRSARRSALAAHTFAATHSPPSRSTRPTQGTSAVQPGARPKLSPPPGPSWTVPTVHSRSAGRTKRWRPSDSSVERPPRSPPNGSAGTPERALRHGAWG